MIGMAAYGRSFRLANEATHGVGAPCGGTPREGPFTREAGFYAYYEVRPLK